MKTVRRSGHNVIHRAGWGRRGHALARNGCTGRLRTQVQASQIGNAGEEKERLADASGDNGGDEENPEEENIFDAFEAKRSQADFEIMEAMRSELQDQLSEREAALSSKIEQLLSKRNFTGVEIEKDAASNMDFDSPSSAEPGVAWQAEPELQRVAVCSVSDSQVGVELFKFLQAVAASALEAPRWVDLSIAGDSPFEELDRLFLGIKVVVVCPDIRDEDRRTLETIREGLKAAIRSVPLTVTKVLLLSRIGSQSIKGGINMRSIFGLGYGGTFAGLEDELTSEARRLRRGLDVVIVRVNPSAPSVESHAGTIRCLPGDINSSGSATSIRTATQALVQALLQSVNTSFCVVEESRKDTDTLLASGTSARDWSELLLPFIGPEVWRIEVANARRAALFVQNWAEEFFGNGGSSTRFGIKTPVQIANTATGVIFKFRPFGSPSGKEFDDLDEGGLELVAEEPATGPPRLRARRCAYGWKAIVKENSERAILGKLKNDWMA